MSGGGTRSRTGQNPDVLRSACEESRAVLDDQLEELTDIGDKAIWTVRTGMIVLGLVISVIAATSLNTLRTLPLTVKISGTLGVVLLLGSSVYGMGTYFSMDRYPGIGDRFRQAARDQVLTEIEWRKSLLWKYDFWISENERLTDSFGTHLFRAQVLFFFGVVALLVAGGLILWPR